MQTRRFWRFIAAAGITLILYILLLLSGGVNPIAEIPEGAREDELERAYERGSQWLDDRERRFARKIDQVKNWLEGGATSAALSVSFRNCMKGMSRCGFWKKTARYLLISSTLSLLPTPEPYIRSSG
jgi:hypothetical protein